jgi:ELWxxDGT repeat protein
MGNVKKALDRSLAVVAVAGCLVAGDRVSRAEVVYRVADLRTSSTGTSMTPALDAETIGSSAILSLDRPLLGAEPWISDGTPAGTHLLRNLAPGGLGSDPDFLGRVGGRVLFAATTPERGRELWVSDGTAAGTALLHEFVAGTRGALFGELGPLGGALLFGVERQQGSLEIWRSDGTAPGTWIVRKIQMTPDGFACRPGSHVPPDSVALGGRRTFCAEEPGAGAELWVTDGTDGGTLRLADLRPGPEGSYPAGFVVDGDRLAFSATDASDRLRIWVLESSSWVPQAAPLPIGVPQLLGVVQSRFLVAVREGAIARLWLTDGTVAGTVAFHDLESDGWSLESAQVGPRVIFTDAVAPYGFEPWVTDGTAAGTHLLHDLVPGPDDSYPGLSKSVAGHDGHYFCAAWDATLWRTDGTSAGTTPIGPTDGCEGLAHGVALAGTTLFQREWYVYCPPHDECEQTEAMRTDGTEAGTSSLRPRDEFSSSAPGDLTPRPGGLVFAARLDREEPWWGEWPMATDGRPEGTVELTVPGDESVILGSSTATLPDGRIFFFEANYPTSRLFEVAGDDLVPVFEGAQGSGLVRAGDLLFFAISDELNGAEPWRSDGTTLGTSLVLDLEPGPAASYPEQLTDIFGRLWFSAVISDAGIELWETDGTVAGTRIHELAPGPASAFDWSPFVTPFREADGSLGVIGQPVNGEHSNLYVLDPVSDTLTLLRESFRGAALIGARVGAGDERLFWIEPEASFVCGLWASDGTAAGTARLADVAPGSWYDGGYAEDCTPELVNAAGRVYFVGCDVAAGCELWSSDGTAAGTSRFADLAPGSTSFLPHSLAVAGDRLYFGGCREATGCEPWISDFSPAGTHPLGEVAPGPASSYAHGFVRSDPRVYFSADDGTGAELWAVPLEIFYDGFEGGNLSRWSATP